MSCVARAKLATSDGQTFSSSGGQKSSFAHGIFYDTKVLCFFSFQVFEFRVIFFESTQNKSWHITMKSSSSATNKTRTNGGNSSSVPKSKSTKKKAVKHSKVKHGDNGKGGEHSICSSIAGLNVEAILQNHVLHATVAATGNLQTMCPTTNPPATSANPLYLAPILSRMETRIKQEYPSEANTYL